MRLTGRERMTSRPHLLVAIGDLVEDVVVWPRGPLAVATDNPSTVTRARGGSAANVAVLAAGLVATRFIGRVGDDRLGRALVAELERAGVEPRVQRAGRTGTIVVLVDQQGERTMFPDRAAGAELADVPLDWVAGAGVVHAPAYCFATPASAATTTALLHAARAGGALVSLDAASADLIRGLGVPAVRAVLADVRPDLLFANADEAALLGLEATGPAGCTVVVKDGPRPVSVLAPGGRLDVPVEPVARVRDTTGAGDAFAAGCLAALLTGADLRSAVRQGNRLAATVLGSPGAGTTPAPIEGAH